MGMKAVQIARRAGLTGLVALVLAGCAGRGEVPDLMKFRNNTGRPDEFSVAPARPLEIPQDVAALPPPQPGMTNRAQQRPTDTAIAALGGSAEAARRAGVPAGDRALLTHTSRFGTDPAIRTLLAREDEDWRRRNRPLLVPRLVGNNLYYEAYEAQSLDQFGEMARLRAQGVRVPSSPPPAPEP